MVVANLDNRPEKPMAALDFSSTPTSPPSRPTTSRTQMFSAVTVCICSTKAANQPPLQPMISASKVATSRDSKVRLVMSATAIRTMTGTMLMIP